MLTAFEVESHVPFGAKAQAFPEPHGYSNIANLIVRELSVFSLAAKLFALDPSLKPAQVIELIRQGATVSEDGRRHLIDEKRSVALRIGRRAFREADCRHGRL